MKGVSPPFTGKEIQWESWKLKTWSSSMIWKIKNNNEEEKKYEGMNEWDWNEKDRWISIQLFMRTTSQCTVYKSKRDSHVCVYKTWDKGAEREKESHFPVLVQEPRTPNLDKDTHGTEYTCTLFLHIHKAGYWFTCCYYCWFLVPSSGWSKKKGSVKFSTIMILH